MSLNSARATLIDATKKLNSRWSRIKDQWDDPSSRRIEEQFIVPLEPTVRGVVSAMNGMSEKINAAERECGDK